MVVFDRPEAAAGWAGAVHQAVAGHDFGPDVEHLRVRIGMHEGEVIAEDADFYGRTVIVAARVGARALGGDTLVTRHLHDLLDGPGVTFGDAVEVELKGLSGSHLLYPLLS